jgi:hypothetical protein
MKRQGMTRYGRWGKAWRDETGLGSARRGLAGKAGPGAAGKPRAGGGFLTIYRRIIIPSDDG